MEYVIIGNSAAAIGAVEGIRSIDKKGNITIISDEPYHTYSRPLISYYLSGKVDEVKMAYRKKDFYEANNVTTRLGVKVLAIDPESRKVILQNGETVDYDKVLVATGGKPFIPPMPGLNKEGVYSFIKLDDVKAIEKVALKNTKAVIVGAGLIGLKAAEALVKRGVEVTVVELANRVLSAILDEEAAAIVQSNLEEHGVKFRLNTTLCEVTGKDKVQGVTLKDGKEIPCDFVVVAIGVTPNVNVVKNTEVKLNRGIIVSETMETNLADVYAAGDVTEGYDTIYGEKRVIPILPNAYSQGEVAGLNMAGQRVEFKGGFAMNSIGFYDLPMITAGIIKPETTEYKVSTVNIPERKFYKKMVLKDNQLVGFICLNKIDRAGIYTSLIADKTDVSSFKDDLLKEDFGYIYFPESLRKERMLKGGRA